VASTGP